MLYLDIDHMDGYRVFTFDAERFPDPAGFVAELEADGFKVVCITDPGVKVDEDYGVYVSGRDRDLYCLTKLAPSTATSSGPACARSRTSRTRRRASGGATSRRRW